MFEKVKPILKERAILVGVVSPLLKKEETDPLAELESLSKTANVEVLSKVVQYRNKFHPATYIGKGKVQEIKNLAEELGANLIIFDDDLSPAQARNLEKELKIRVIDRTELILYIFAIHAKSNAAKLQVELAQLEYALPRLKRMWEHLDRYEGGIGTKGPGEKQLEIDKRLIKKRIQILTKKIKEIQQRKEREVRSRNNRFFTVGLVGYTNAGKSTLMNVLTNAEVVVEDKLFATLDTKTKIWEITKGRKVLLSDTVGFIDKLPHNLVASFKATLEEASQSDILLHVVDISHPKAEKHIKVVHSVLEEIGLENKERILVFNKIDKVKDKVELNYFCSLYKNHVLISAKNKENLDKLGEKVLEALERAMVEVEIKIPVSDGKLISLIENDMRILEKKLEEKFIYYKFKAPISTANWLKHYCKQHQEENYIYLSNTKKAS